MPPMPSISGGSGSSPSSAGAPQTLDAGSVNWLAGFCTGFSDVASYSGPDTTGMTDDEVVQAIVNAYDSMATAAATARSDLKAMPEPTFPGHDKIVPAVLSWFGSVNSVYGQGAQTIASTSFSSMDQLSTAVNKVESGMDSANTSFGQAIGTVDPSVTATMKSLPECASLVGNGG